MKKTNNSNIARQGREDGSIPPWPKSEWKPIKIIIDFGSLYYYYGSLFLHPIL